MIGYKEAFFDDSSLTLNIIMEFAAGGDIQKRIENRRKNIKVYFDGKTIGRQNR